MEIYKLIDYKIIIEKWINKDSRGNFEKRIMTWDLFYYVLKYVVKFLELKEYGFGIRLDRLGV